MLLDAEGYRQAQQEFRALHRDQTVKSGAEEQWIMFALIVNEMRQQNEFLHTLVRLLSGERDDRARKL